MIRNFNINDFKIVSGNSNTDKITIENGQTYMYTDQTSTVLAYRKQIKQYTVLTITGAIFVNLEKLFPCAKGIIPVCHLFPYEGDEFRKGK